MKKLQESELEIIESYFIKFDVRKFFTVNFTDEEQFMRAIRAYSPSVRSPVFAVSAKDDQLVGYGPDVKMIYNVVCPNDVLLKGFVLEGDQDGKEE